MVKWNEKSFSPVLPACLEDKKLYEFQFYICCLKLPNYCLITLNSPKENGKRTDSTSFPGCCQGTNHGDIFILIT